MKKKKVERNCFLYCMWFFCNFFLHNKNFVQRLCLTNVLSFWILLHGMWKSREAKWENKPVRKFVIWSCQLFIIWWLDTWSYITATEIHLKRYFFFLLNTIFLYLNGNRLGQQCWGHPQKCHIRLCRGGKAIWMNVHIPS